MATQRRRQSPSQVVSEAVRHIELDRIRADISRLCVTPRNSSTDTEQHRRAAEYIAGELSSAGCDVERQEFTVPSEPEPRPGLNIIGTLQATNPKTPSAQAGQAVLIGAHYDTVPGSPGADDNASGVAVMLECARVLADTDRKRPLVFVGFDAEERQPEVGLHGSTAYVRDAVLAQARSDHGQALSAAYILEMVGYSAPEGGQKVPPGLQLVFPRAFDRLAYSRFKGDSVVVISDWKSRGISRKLEQAARTLPNGSDGISILPIEVPRWMPVPHNLRRSDHAPFWKAGIPAVMIGDTANFRNPNYHAASDVPETLDYDLIGRVTRTLVAAVTTDATAEAPTKKPRVKLR